LVRDHPDRRAFEVVDDRNRSYPLDMLSPVADNAVNDDIVLSEWRSSWSDLATVRDIAGCDGRTIDQGHGRDLLGHPFEPWTGTSRGEVLMPADSSTHAIDVETLQKLNRDYIACVQSSDVQRFDEILAEDFLNSNPDGTLVDRAGFLEQIARPAKIKNLEAHDLRIRLFGDVAIIHARTTYTKPDGQAGSGRYTDIWARRKGRWLAVAAHVTRG